MSVLARLVRKVQILTAQTRRNTNILVFRSVSRIAIREDRRDEIVPNVRSRKFGRDGVIRRPFWRHRGAGYAGAVVGAVGAAGIDGVEQGRRDVQRRESRYRRQGDGI